MRLPFSPLISLVFLTHLTFANDDLVRRRWDVPEFTPIIEVDPDAPGVADPFRGDQPLKTFEVFKDDEIQQWLQSLGVEFPPGSQVTYRRKAKGRNSLIVRNTPTNLELVDLILKASYPVQTCQTLLKRFLAETKDVPLEKLPGIVRKYPAQALGPLQNIIIELDQLDQKLAADLPQDLKRTVSSRRSRIIKILPESIDATRRYFGKMVIIMGE